MYKIFIALRYLRAHRIIYFSIAGVALGIAAMVIVTSVMGGFSRDIRARIRGMQADLTLTVRASDLYLPEYEELVEKILIALAFGSLLKTQEAILKSLNERGCLIEEFFKKFIVR